MAFRLLMALSQIQDGCHSWQPAIHQIHPETALLLPFTGIKKISSYSLKFSMIGLPVKPEHKVRKEWHLSQMPPCTQKMNTYFLLPMLVFSGLFYNMLSRKNLLIISTAQIGRLSAAISCPTTKQTPNSTGDCSPLAAFCKGSSRTLSSITLSL